MFRPLPRPEFVAADRALDVAAEDLVLGVEAGMETSAYPVSHGLSPHPERRDRRGTDRRHLLNALPHRSGVEIEPGRSDTATLDFAFQPGTNPPVLRDSETGSTWDFSGSAISGPRKGRRPGRVPCLKDYWFDWKDYHPGTRVFAAEEPALPQHRR